jgi:hypothetical protein
MFGSLARRNARGVSVARMAFVASLLFAGLASGPAAAAILFNFSWTADPAQDPNIIVSPDPTITATGTMTIDAGPGETFSLSDIIAVNINVSGATIAPFTITSWVDAAGSIAADGLSATFVGSGSHEPFAFLASGAFFGCERTDCLNVDGTQGELFVRDANAVGSRLFYTSGVAALSSMRLTAAVNGVPLPGTVPLLLGGLLALAVVRRRREQ